MQSPYPEIKSYFTGKIPTLFSRSPSQYGPSSFNKLFEEVGPHPDAPSTAGLSSRGVKVYVQREVQLGHLLGPPGAPGGSTSSRPGPWYGYGSEAMIQGPRLDVKSLARRPPSHWVARSGRPPATAPDAAGPGTPSRKPLPVVIGGGTLEKEEGSREGWGTGKYRSSQTVGMGPPSETGLGLLVPPPSFTLPRRSRGTGGAPTKEFRRGPKRNLK